MAERELNAQEIGELLRPMLGPLRAFQHLKTLIDESIKLESRQHSLETKITVLGETLPQLEAERVTLVEAIEGYSIRKQQAEETFAQTVTAHAEALTQADERLQAARGEIKVASEEAQAYLQAEMAKVETVASERRMVLEAELLAREAEWHVAQQDRDAVQATQALAHAELMAIRAQAWQVQQQQQEEFMRIQEHEHQERVAALEDQSETWERKIEELKAAFEALHARLQV